MNGVFNLPCFHALYRDKVKKPGTAATESTQITEPTQNEEIKFDEDSPPPVQDLDF